MTKLEELTELLQTYQQALKEAQDGILETRLQITEELKRMGVLEAVQPQNGNGKRVLFGGHRTPTPVVDTETMIEYKSKAECGRELGYLVNDFSNFAWYQLLKAFPGRFVEKQEIEQAVS